VTAKRKKQLTGGVVPKHPSKRKEPRAATSPLAEKQARSLHVSTPDVMQRRPVWRFADLDIDGPPESGSLTADDFREMHSTLASYESQTLLEIWGQQNNGCKRYELDSAHENIIKRLEELERDDETALHTLRVQGAYRIYGVLREHIFYVLWIDHRHHMWPSVKKHT
jgi:hypothetical protein